MKYTLFFWAGAGFMPFVSSPVLRGGICEGNSLFCFFLICLVYMPYYVVLTTIIFIVLIVSSITLDGFRRTFNVDNRLIYFIYSSCILSIILIFFYHNFLSIGIENQRIANSRKQELIQLNYEVYEPTYIPVGHNLFETRVDSDNLSFYFQRNEGGLFIISEFIKPPTIDLSPPDCYIEGGHFEVVDGSGSSSSAAGGYCKEIKTPKGTPVYLMTERISSEEKLAAFILGNTLITIFQYNFSDQELMNLIDGLEKKSASDITFKVRNWR